MYGPKMGPELHATVHWGYVFGLLAPQVASSYLLYGAVVDTSTLGFQ